MNASGGMAEAAKEGAASALVEALTPAVQNFEQGMSAALASQQALGHRLTTLLGGERKRGRGREGCC